MGDQLIRYRQSTHHHGELLCPVRLFLLSEGQYGPSVLERREAPTEPFLTRVADRLADCLVWLVHYGFDVPILFIRSLLGGEPMRRGTVYPTLPALLPWIKTHQSPELNVLGDDFRDADWPVNWILGQYLQTLPQGQKSGIITRCLLCDREVTQEIKPVRFHEGTGHLDDRLGVRYACLEGHPLFEIVELVS